MTVYANNLEVSCKKQSNQVIAAFPDVCFTPPQAPPTPPGVPIPYPSFGSDGDTDKGTGTVKIGDETINLKNNSHFTKTTGTEAGSASKKGIISSKNTGKAKSQAYSMNVKAEGKNICRFSDIETNNHGSPPNTPPWPKIGTPHVPDPTDPCDANKQAVSENCPDNKTIKAACKKAGLHISPSKRETDGYTHSSIASRIKRALKKNKPKYRKGYVRTNEQLIKMADKAQKDKCLSALACKLPKYKEGCPCPGQTGHHVVPASSFFNKGRGENPKPGEKPLKIHTPPKPKPKKYKKPPPYKAKEAPVICAEGCSNTTGSHGMMHTEMKAYVMKNGKKVGLEVQGKRKKQSKTSVPYNKQRDAAIASVERVFPLSKCDPACLKAQLDDYHVNELGMKKSQPLRADKCGRSKAEVPDAQKMAKVRQANLEKGL